MTARNTRRALWGAGIATSTAGLLRRMRGDFERDNRFRPSTAAMVYASYGVQLTVIAELMAHPTRRLPIPRGTALVLGGTLGVAGVGTFAAAGNDFGSARQLSGTETGNLIDQGVYQVRLPPPCSTTGSATRRPTSPTCSARSTATTALTPPAGSARRPP